MRAQGHQLFVDELQRFVAEAADPRVTAIAYRVAAPLRVAVSGRRGVGRSTVARALAGAGLEVTSQPDTADVDVYVIAEVVKPEDRDAIAAARHPVLAVLNKADLTGFGPDGSVAAARNRCTLLSAVAGVPMEPMVGLLAVAVVDGLLDDALCDALQVLAHRLDPDSPDAIVAARHAVRTEIWLRLLDTLDVFGIALAIAAVRQGRPAREVRALLRRVSCVDAVAERITAIGAEVQYQRVLDAIAELEALGVTDGGISEFLSCDDTVIARMAAAADVVEAAGLKVGRCDDPATHLPRAVRWQRYSRGPVSAVQRACSTDITRGSLRLWSQAGGSPRPGSTALRFGESP
ncbi:MAG TPA: hypothetical protein VEF72_06010 [Mycobacterium sp.]|nr:hypothetical protein [Mycobacterium sp.]